MSDATFTDAIPCSTLPIMALLLFDHARVGMSFPLETFSQVISMATTTQLLGLRAVSSSFHDFATKEYLVRKGFPLPRPNAPPCAAMRVNAQDFPMLHLWRAWAHFRLPKSMTLCYSPSSEDNAALSSQLWHTQQFFASIPPEPSVDRLSLHFYDLPRVDAFPDVLRNLPSCKHFSVFTIINQLSTEMLPLHSSYSATLSALSLTSIAVSPSFFVHPDAMLWALQTLNTSPIRYLIVEKCYISDALWMAFLSRLDMRYLQDIHVDSELPITSSLAFLQHHRNTLRHVTLGHASTLIHPDPTATIPSMFGLPSLVSLRGTSADIHELLRHVLPPQSLDSIAFTHDRLDEEINVESMLLDAIEISRLLLSCPSLQRLELYLPPSDGDLFSLFIQANLPLMKRFRHVSIVSFGSVSSTVSRWKRSSP